MPNIKDKILQAKDLPCEKLFIPEWDVTCFVRVLTGTERDKWESDLVGSGQTNLVNVRARLAVLCLVDEKGDRVFQDTDATELGKKSSKCLDQIFECAARVNGLRKQDLDELTKNLPAAQSGNSTSA